CRYWWLTKNHDKGCWAVNTVKYGQYPIFVNYSKSNSSQHMSTTIGKHSVKGGEFLLKVTQPEDIFIPEEWSEEQRMIAQTLEDFIVQNIHPRLDEIDSMQDKTLMPTIVEQV